MTPDTKIILNKNDISTDHIETKQLNLMKSDDEDEKEQKNDVKKNSNDSSKFQKNKRYTKTNHSKYSYIQNPLTECTKNSRLQTSNPNSIQCLSETHVPLIQFHRNGNYLSKNKILDLIFLLNL
jgi:hypothetical protein